MFLDLNEARKVYSDFLAEDPNARWRMDAAFAHAITWAYTRGLTDDKWRPMSDAPRDGTPILALCLHDAPAPTSHALAILYTRYYEGMSHVDDGAHVLVWGNYDQSPPTTETGTLDEGWWWLSGSDYQIAANPTVWMAIPEVG